MAFICISLLSSASYSSCVPQAWISASGKCFFLSFALCAFHQEKGQWAGKGGGLGQQGGDHPSGQVGLRSEPGIRVAES